MKKLIPLIFFISLFTNVHGQKLTYEQVDSLVVVETGKLLQKTDSVLIFQEILNGYLVTSDDGCNCDNINYIVHKVKNKTKVLIIDCCSPHKLKRIKDNLLWNKFSYKSKFVFDSQFKVTDHMFHYVAQNLILRTKDDMLQIETRNYYFEEGCDFQDFNSKQPAKLFIDELNNYIALHLLNVEDKK